MAKTPKPAPAVRAAVSPAEDGKSAFVVTDTAPAKVAGRRVSKGEVIRLTEDEARAELLALHIRPEGLPPKAKAPKAEEPQSEEPKLEQPRLEAPSKDV